MTCLALILGCAGPILSPEEAAFFREVRPWGFILFKRNIGTPDEVRALTGALRDCVGSEQAPVLIDQEGGRVQRMGPPHWPAYPAGGRYGRLNGSAATVARLGARLMAHDLAEVGNQYGDGGFDADGRRRRPRMSPSSSRPPAVACWSN